MFKKKAMILCAVFGLMLSITTPPQNMEMLKQRAVETTTYEIYPKPHTINYDETSYILRKDANVVLDSTIDEATQNRLKEILDLKGITLSYGDKVVEGTTNILLGTKGSGEYVESYVNDQVPYDRDTLDETDSYVLSSNQNVISILGKDTDACFYGLTSFYHIIKQIDSYTVQDFVIEDYAAVVSRGFIEGYYGNPWSVEDRVELMKWGGYYKLNSYFYAPKDDPKHNAKWRELYTEEEIETKIKPLAEAGNNSKCRFVFALHPYMSNAIRYNSEENYQADLAVMKAKFTQVIEAGVRQISILADDAGHVGNANYIRTLEDMSDWLKEMQETYPDLKTTLPFCTQEYMTNGYEYYADFPENVQIVMTGGRVWGEVSDSFTTTFTNNVGRGPYMWVNWPCTDNSKKHLIMGGYDTFLHPGVDANKIEGIVLNPMQQSEPSKVAIFGNACYSWNIWEDKAEADETWTNSFKYVDHNSAIENEASIAFRELSKHMINQNMDSRVTVLQESVELKAKLNEFKEKLKQNLVTEADVDQIKAEFETLQKATDVFTAQGGDERLLEQMKYWLECWKETNDAAINYLNAIKADLNRDSSGLLAYQTKAKESFDQSKEHAFWYVDHYEKAEVGVQHIVPFINTLAEYTSLKAESILNPDAIIKTFITNRKDNPVGSTSNVFDGDDNSQLSFRNPVWIYEGDYVGVMFNRTVDVNYIRFLLGNGKNHMESAKLEYTLDGETWETISSKLFLGVQGSYLEAELLTDELPSDFKALGIRLIATANNKLDAYLNVHEITINKESTPIEEVSGTYSTNLDRANNVSFDKLNDSVIPTATGEEVWLAKLTEPNKDQVPADSYLMYTFDIPQVLDKVTFAQGGSVAGDVIADGVLEYLDGETWKTLDDITNAREQVFAFDDMHIETTAVRIRNEVLAPIWWRIGEFRVDVKAEDATPISYSIIRTDRWKVYQGSESNLYNGNDDSFVWYDPDGSENTTNDDFLVDDFIGYDLGKVAKLKNAHIVVGYDNGDKLKTYAIETSLDNETWNAVEGYEAYTGKSSGKDTLDIELNGLQARYIRIRNLEVAECWGKFTSFTVEEMPTKGDTLHVLTNTNANVYADLSEEGIVSLTTSNVTLANGDFIGVLLDNIKEVSSITTTSLSSGLEIQTSMNGYTWETYNSEAVDAKFIRVINTGNESQQFSTEGFAVSYTFVGERSVTSTFGKANDEDIRVARKVDAVFDGDLTTHGMVTGAQDASKHILFDLGQTIDFSSIRYYVNETQLNYLRSAVFEISNQPDGVYTPIMTINEAQNFENVWDATTAKDAAWLTHDSQNPGNMYAEGTNLNASGRYLRVRPLKTYSHRWVAFGEIVINNGTYISTESNKDIISEHVEQRNHEPSNMLDKDFTTTYKSSATNSSFTYRISDPLGAKSIRLVQLGTISGATVEVTYADGTKVNVGKLNQTINEFLFAQTSMVKEIKVSWSDIIPEISEITIGRKTLSSADTTTLEAELAKGVDDTWTQSSKDTYASVANVAQKIIDHKEHRSQEMVDMALGALKTARSNAKTKLEDSNELEELLDQKLSNEDQVYTVTTFNTYTIAINALEHALDDMSNLDQATATQLEEAVQSAIDKLEYSIFQREQAMLAIETLELKDSECYTSKSYAALQEKMEELFALIDTDQENRVHPLEIKELKEQMLSTYGALVNVEALVELITTYNAIDGTLYTTESFTAYKESVEAAEALLVDGTKEEIEQAVTAIQNTFDALELLDETVDMSELNTLIETVEALDEAAYTPESWTALQEALETAKAVVSGDTPTQEAIDQAYASLDEAYKGLEQVAPESMEKQILKIFIDLAQVEVDNGNVDKLIDGAKAEYYAALEEAIDLYEDANATSEAMSLSIIRLTEALELLDYIKADMTKLQALYDECLAVNLDDYMNNEAKENFMAALENAKAVLSIEGGALTYEVEEAYEQLESTLVQLVLKPSKDALAYMISLAEAKDANADRYTKESYGALLEALAEAKEVYEDEDATAEQISTQVNKLAKVIAQLRLKVDRSYLSAKVEGIKATDFGAYTEASVARLMSVVSDAEAFLATPEQPADVEAVQLQALSEKLDEALATLEIKDEKPTEPETPEKPEVKPEPSEPTTPEQPGNGDSGGNERPNYQLPNNDVTVDNSNQIAQVTPGDNDDDQVIGNESIAPETDKAQEQLEDKPIVGQSTITSGLPSYVYFVAGVGMSFILLILLKKKEKEEN
ncbi:hypothetical protein A4S06_10355 [Erysipelotrichaceae bacterium MTC7]|nr:hypothetical protein A4S06_10355 [Erysipelotrichaceae bacterium MTC7]